MRSALLFSLVYLFLNLDGFASLKPFDPLYDFFPEKKSNIVDQSFAGLHFKINKDLTKCTQHSPLTMTCELFIKNNVIGKGETALLVFDKQIISSEAGIRVRRLYRKARWYKQYPSINRYVEEQISVAGEQTVLQQAVYFRHDNIKLPVLLHAFDVVMNNRTSISVTAICDGHRWPMIRENLASIVSSIYKAAK